MAISLRSLLLGVAVGALAMASTACSDGDDGGSGAPTTTAASPTTAAPAPTEPGTAPTPQPTLRAAVEGLLDAEVAGDPATSYRFLGSEAREQYRDVAEWTRRRSQLPTTEGYEVTEADDEDTVVAEVTHPPGLDPFIGLSAARERHTFSGEEVDGGWLVAAEPEVEYLLPPTSEAVPVVEEWAAAVQACDEAAGGELEAVDQVFGASVGASELCGSSGAVTGGEPTELLAGPQSTDLIAQYSTDILAWATVVPVTGPVTPFSVVLAPIGSDWRVLAVAD
ncbi:hypothetical protein PO878_06010 [Iamia majanohamensis]|uniref:Lipoprotein n=1 Tax=Iamia majanohamensis TaxID=467976 RepID=A0AAE9Y7R6_9ACTN|nr:hypothetical protein [Iamia majanohamensis]WCO68280.1 hypothetical protein PO878_06010 [Iamia majanohamensis]